MTLALLILATIMPYNAIAQTRLGLHVTQEELNIWKQRAQNGPYKSTGDVRTNSPVIGLGSLIIKIHFYRIRALSDGRDKPLTVALSLGHLSRAKVQAI